MASINYDFIIVGAGSSGSALASVLSTKGLTLLIERGANHTAYPMSTVRQGWPQIAVQVLEKYKAKGSGHWLGTANVLGGGSALNGCACWRAEREIFEGLGLDLEKVERNFEYLEDRICLTKEDSEYDKIIIDAWRNHSFHVVESSSGFGSWSNISSSSPTVQRARTILDPLGKRKPASFLFESALSYDGSSILSQGNLTVFLLSKVKRVLFSDNKEAVGVDINSPAGDFSVYVRKGGKVFLNAGSFETPKLLMLSGIGSSETLLKFDIPVVYDNPEVGRNLIERKDIGITLPMMKSIEGDDVSMFDIAAIGKETWASPFHKYAVEWGNLLQACNACAPVNRTDVCIEQMFGALSFYGGGRDSSLSPMYVAQRHPMTRGTVTLASSNYNDSPIVDDGWDLVLENLSPDARHDLDVLVDGLMELVLNVISDTSLLDAFGYPLSNKTGEFPTGFFDVVNKGFAAISDELDKCSFSKVVIPDNQCSSWDNCFPTIPTLPNERNKLREVVFETLASSHHCAGTCRAGAVVEKGSLAVKGVQGLYVSDLSVVTQPVDIHPMMSAMALGLIMGESIESVPMQDHDSFPVTLSIICVTVLVFVLALLASLLNKDQKDITVTSTIMKRISPLTAPKIVAQIERSLVDNLNNGGHNDHYKKSDFSKSTMSTSLMVWSGVSCTYETGRRTKKSSVTPLINNFGSMNEGEVTAIMGPSGSGKSTLLNILAGRKSVGTVRGDFSVLGRPFNVSTNGLRNLSAIMKGELAYIPQQEYFYPTQTCEEVVAFQANMKFGRANPVERRSAVHNCLSIVGLPPGTFADRKIGGDLAGRITLLGLSGGERKRLALACALVLKPKMLFIDELTSGLDSENSLLIMNLLKNLSIRERVASMVIIHQPDPEMFALFDRLILLSKGRCIFSDNVSNLSTFYECNYEEKEPSDTMIARDLIRKASAFDLDNNNFYRGESLDLSVVKTKPSQLAPDTSSTSGYFWKLFIIFQRNLTNQYVRNITNVGARLVSYSTLSAIVGAIFWQVGSSDLERGLSMDEASKVIGSSVFLLTISYLLPFASIPVFVSDKRFLAAESALDLYESWMYGASQIFLEFVFLTLASIVETSIVFPMCTMANPTIPIWRSYLTVLSILNFSGLVGSTLVLCCSIWLPSQDLAFLVASTISTISLSLSGGFLPFAEMPGLANALQWISPIKYSFQALVIAQLTGTSSEKLIDLSEFNTPSTTSENIYVLFCIFICLSILTAIGMARVKEVY